MSDNHHTNKGQQHWHLDKRVPLSMIFALLVYAVTAIWFASGISTRMDFNERKLDEVDDKAVEALNKQSELLERLARIEERGNQQIRLLERLESRLSKEGM